MRVSAWLAAVALLMSSPSASQTTYDIAVTVTGESGEGIYVMRGDGSNAKLLRAESGALLTAASWSPDGTRIAYPWFDVGPDGRLVDISLPMHTPLYVVNADGSGRERLPDMPVEPFFRWSPDGRRLAVSSGFEDPARKKSPSTPSELLSVQVAIYVVDVQTRKVNRVTTFGQNRYPSWSPDGRRIAFSGETDTRNTDILVVDADGQNLRRLTTAPTYEVAPEWSPQGDRIAYVAPSTMGTGNGIFVMNADGSGARRISAQQAEMVTWSPDGAHLLAGSSLINVATGETTEPLPKAVLDTVFGPDGRAILYRLRDAGSNPSWSIFSVDLQGQNARRIASAATSFSVGPMKK